MDNNTLYWIWLSRRPRIGAKGQRQLLRQFGSPDALYAADEETLTRAGLSPAVRKALLDKDLEPARAILDRCRNSGVRVLCLAEPDYPSRLLLQEDAPALLYYRGQLPGEERPVIGLVGARDADEAGQRLAFRLGAEIAACGGSVVTGMARGIDARSAEGALAQGGAVIGVLGCGPDLAYPPENAALYARVAEQGCLLSEYSPGTAPNARNFPVRNRLISALSDAVVVVRAAENSGSLITARWAAAQGREVFAVPGDPEDPLCRGCNALLRDGAYAAASGWDVLRRYEFRYPGVVRMQDAKCKMQNEGSGIKDQGSGVRQTSPARRAGQSGGLSRISSPVQQLCCGNWQQPDGEPPSRAVEGSPRQQSGLSNLSPPQRRIVEALSGGPLQLDALIDRTGLPAAQVLPQLTLLQIKHTITQRPGKLYELSGG